MSRVLVLGMCPLPWENEPILSGLGIRTWHFTSPLLNAGHEVFLVGCRTGGTYADIDKPVLKVKHEAMRYFSVAWKRFAKAEYLEELYDEFEPDCMLGPRRWDAS